MHLRFFCPKHYFFNKSQPKFIKLPLNYLLNGLPKTVFDNRTYRLNHTTTLHLPNDSLALWTCFVAMYSSRNFIRTLSKLSSLVRILRGGWTAIKCSNGLLSSVNWDVYLRQSKAHQQGSPQCKRRVLSTWSKNCMLELSPLHRLG